MNSICGRVALVVCAAAFALAACSSRDMPSMVQSPNDAAQSVLRASPYVRLMAETSPVNNIAGFRLSGTATQCGAENVSPALSWSNAPVGTRSFALVLFDETANFAHWGIYNVRPVANRLMQGIKPGDIPGSWMQAIDDAGVQGYFGPCPPRGTMHRYVFTIYALDTALDLRSTTPLESPNIESLLNAMNGHVLGRAGVMNLLQKT
jgi:Raf kinase inhibitor-like YbhB/YbcL family protein